ncbi:MAG TPA: ABC transporter permease [Candidatus Rokubacteria bacterium]|nr:MAG: ABC transporter permease [Candidatus Rokubacteria bacterium GWA2_70_23]OGK93566.1 MAG: ABC transporter permease [Candidatus Rokubacteria bacterium GWF2_70_14]HAM54292.1 ABC transporter permease [Candidatus Rokubacteria bacterium]
MTGARRVIATLIRRKPLGAVGAVIALGMVLVAIFADVLAPYEFNDTALLRALQRPGATHWFGTDELGRDVYSRVIHGARVSMLVGLAATAISIGLGGLIGIVSGYFGRRVDLVLQRLVDAWMAFPGLVMAIVILALLGPGLWSVILALGVSQAFSQSRTIRSATLVVREQPYIEASLAVGASHWRVLGRHVLPNVVAPIIIVASTFLGFVILVEAAVSFLGYGVPPPRPSWGGMLSATGRVYMIRAPWLSIFPGLALSLAVFGFNVLGDALRDLLDPRLRAS